MDEQLYFDGRCSECGNENIIGNDDDGYECPKCGWKFILIMDTDMAFDMEHEYEY